MIAALSHYAIAKEWGPVVVMPLSGRPTYLVRWASWIANTPSLVLLMHTATTTDPYLKFKVIERSERSSLIVVVFEVWNNLELCRGRPPKTPFLIRCAPNPLLLLLHFARHRK